MWIWMCMLLTLWYFGTTMMAKMSFAKTNRNSKRNENEEQKKHTLYICIVCIYRRLPFYSYVEIKILLQNIFLDYYLVLLFWCLVFCVDIFICLQNIYFFSRSFRLFSTSNTHWHSIALNIYKRDCGHISMYMIFQGLSRIYGSGKLICHCHLCVFAWIRFVK